MEELRAPRMASAGHQRESPGSEWTAGWPVGSYVSPNVSSASLAPFYAQATVPGSKSHKRKEQMQILLFIHVRLWGHLIL